MDINSIGGNRLAPKALQGMMQGKNQDEESLLAQSSAELEKKIPKILIEEKDYTKATLKGMQAESSSIMQQNAILTAATLDAGQIDDESYAMRNLAGRRGARRMMEYMQKRAAEESERNLKESREAIEEKAEQVLTEGTAAQTQATEQTVSAPAPAPDSGAESSTPEDADTAATAAPTPATPSIDITV